MPAINMSSAAIVNVVGAIGIIALIGIIIRTFLTEKTGLILTVSEKPGSIREMTLEKLSENWKKGKKTEKGQIQEFPIENLVPLWRNVKPMENGPEANINLQHQRAAAFWRENFGWFKQAPLHKDVCVQILLMLDREGNCPSVVNASDDIESSWDSNTYQLLGMTTLMDHSLNVAEEIIKLLIDTESWHVIPDGLVAALGHDLGKLPVLHAQLYALGEHPLAAGSALARIKEYKTLPRKEEIGKAIKLHHKNAEGLLGQNLKRADQLARQKELEYAIERIEENAAAANAALSAVEDASLPVHVAVVATLPQSVTPNVQAAPIVESSIAQPAPVAENLPTPEEPPQSAPVAVMIEPEGQVDVPLDDPEPVKEPEVILPGVQSAVSQVARDTTVADNKPVLDNPISIPPTVPTPAPQRPNEPARARKAQNDIFGDPGGEVAGASKSKKQQTKLSKVNISHWFDADSFLEDMKPYINKTKGRWFQAFSMPDGIVYSQPKVLEEIIRRHAARAGATDIITMAMDDDVNMRNILFSVVSHFRDNYDDVIDKSLIGDDFFGGKFIISKKNNVLNLKGYYVPFHAEAFGSIAEMEAKKPAMLKNFKSVELDTNKEA